MHMCVRQAGGGGRGVYLGNVWVEFGTDVLESDHETLEEDSGVVPLQTENAPQPQWVKRMWRGQIGRMKGAWGVMGRGRLSGVSQ